MCTNVDLKRLLPKCKALSLNFSFIQTIFVNVRFSGSDSDHPKRKRGRKNMAKKERSRRGAVETLKGKMVKSKETISTSESDSDAGGLKIASG